MRAAAALLRLGRERPAPPTATAAPPPPQASSGRACLLRALAAGHTRISHTLHSQPAQPLPPVPTPPQQAVVFFHGDRVPGGAGPLAARLQQPAEVAAVLAAKFPRASVLV